VGKLTAWSVGLDEDIAWLSSTGPLGKKRRPKTCSHRALQPAARARNGVGSDGATLQRPVTASRMAGGNGSESRVMGGMVWL
jgi:hypothetical protein